LHFGDTNAPLSIGSRISRQSKKNPVLLKKKILSPGQKKLTFASSLSG